MTTPITHAVRSADHLIDIVRRLETDRAALMEALEQTLDAWELGYKTTECHEPENARRALAAARANFPQP